MIQLVSSWYLTIWWLGWSGLFERYRWGYGYGDNLQREFRIWLGPIVVRFPSLQDHRRAS